TKTANFIAAKACNHIGALVCLGGNNREKERWYSVINISEVFMEQSTKKKLSPKKSHELVFKKSSFASDTNKITVTANKCMELKNSVNVERFRENLQMYNPKAGWLLNFPNKCERKSKRKPLVSITYQYHDCVDLKSDKVKSEIQRVFDSIIVNDVKQIEFEKRRQINNTKWINERLQRITSSSFGQVVNLKENTKPEAMLRRHMIYLDQKCWDNAAEKLKNFYINNVLPELFSSRVKGGDYFIVHEFYKLVNLTEKVWLSKTKSKQYNKCKVTHEKVVVLLILLTCPVAGQGTTFENMNDR
ncbi:hypothetical protein KUTeg_018706, partial [Tegillarca granosa]